MSTVVTTVGGTAVTIAVTAATTGATDASEDEQADRLRATMIWAILALLGVPLRLCAVGIMVIVFRSRSL